VSDLFIEHFYTTYEFRDIVYFSSSTDSSSKMQAPKRFYLLLILFGIFLGLNAHINERTRINKKRGKEVNFQSLDAIANTPLKVIENAPTFKYHVSAFFILLQKAYTYYSYRDVQQQRKGTKTMRHVSTSFPMVLAGHRGQATQIRSQTTQIHGYKWSALSLLL